MTVPSNHTFLTKKNTNVREYRRNKTIDNPERLATKGTQDEEKHNTMWTPLYANKQK
jgi:hypothetical protein